MKQAYYEDIIKELQKNLDLKKIGYQDWVSDFTTKRIYNNPWMSLTKF